MIPIRFAIVLAAFFLGLGWGLWVFRILAAQTPTSTSGALEHLKTDGDDYDVIVIGSSLVRVNFVPPVFDRRMKEHGCKIRSFNFALSGLMGSEMDYYIGQILRLNLPRLKWLLLDVTLSQYPRLKKKNFYKLRLIRWHNWDQYSQVQRAILESNTPFLERLSRLSIHAQHLLLNLGNIGEGMYLVNNNPWLGEQPKAKKRFHFHVGPGIRKLQKKKVTRYRMLRSEQHVNDVARLTQTRESGRLRRRHLQLADRWHDLIASRDINPVFVVGPSLVDASIRLETEDGRRLHVIDLNDPRSYPNLYNLRDRCDPAHMAYNGAIHYTKALADVFVEQFGDVLR